MTVREQKTKRYRTITKRVMTGTETDRGQRQKRLEIFRANRWQRRNRRKIGRTYIWRTDRWQRQNRDRRDRRLTEVMYEYCTYNRAETAEKYT